MLLLIDSNCHKEFVNCWNMLLNCFKNILESDKLTLFSLYISFAKQYCRNYKTNEEKPSKYELKSAIKNLKEGARITRNCCGENHEISKFVYTISQNVYIIYTFPYLLIV